MPQTIAVQRGFVSCTWNNSATTLFTQSTGNATRVILGGLYAYSNGTAGSRMMSLHVNSNASGRFMPVLYQVVPQSSAALYVMPNSKYDPSGTGNSGTIYSNASVIYNRTLSDYDGAGNNSLISQGVSWNTSQRNFGDSDLTMQYNCSDFWMGPGDVLSWKGSDGNSNSGGVAYFFITITES